MLKVIAGKIGLDGHYTSLESRIENAVSIDYSYKTYAILFFSYSVIGWLWEFILFLSLYKEPVNTGILHGPWLPIYGLGGILALELLKNIRYSPGKTFISVMIVAGIIEYSAHAASEIIFGFTWWDYNDYLLNINGRICIEGLVIFGILGCISIYFISPKINEFYAKIDEKWQNRLILGLSVFFLFDILISLINPNMNNIY